jgi:phosphoribosylaminoimidazolecarboxamide formyltransferase/IMP cyclohydrolase
MLDGNLLSIFGGVVMTNFPITKELATVVRTYHSDVNRNLDMIVAPSYEDGAIEILGRKGDACKIVELPGLAHLGPDCMDKNILLRFVRKGFLAQENYSFVLDLNSDTIENPADIILSDKEKMDLVLAWAINVTSNSNTITMVKDCMLIGNGVGQQDRKECCELVIKRAHDAKHITRDATICSDSFFPFDDGPRALVNAGIGTVFTTSGSIRDKDTIELLLKCGVSLLMISNKLGRGFGFH